MYHDVIESENASDSSGFPGGAAASYKLVIDHFAAHLDAIREVRRRTSTASTLGRDQGELPPLLLTFDDGGASALKAADLLEERGFRGHFFVTTDYLDTATFLTRDDVRELASRGHVVGSHSCSHPTRMSRCTREQLLDEWRRSLATLAEVLGEPVDTASVPGGHHSLEVAVAASEAGVRTLFTSEPTTRTHTVNGCRVVGRFAIQRDHTPEDAAAIAAGDLGPRVKQLLYWNLKKVAKTVAGDLYLELRRRTLR